MVGDAVWIDEADTGRDVWGNNAILAYVPNMGSGGSADISLAEPGFFGFTNVLEGHPFAETPYYEPASKAGSTAPPTSAPAQRGLQHRRIPVHQPEIT